MTSYTVTAPSVADPASAGVEPRPTAALGLPSAAGLPDPVVAAAPIDQQIEGSELLEVWAGLVEATSLVNERLTDGLERSGVSAPFFDVLVRLAHEPSQRLPMTKLAGEVSLTSGGFTKLADRMEQEGLLYRQHSAHDRRVIYAVLTDAGRAAAATVFPAHVADLRRHLGDALGAEGTATLAALCRKLRETNASSAVR